MTGLLRRTLALASAVSALLASPRLGAAPARGVAVHAKKKANAILDEMGACRREEKPISSTGVPLKKPLSGYMHFCAKVRPDVTAKLKEALGDGAKPTLVMQRMGTMWSELAVDEKSYYQDLAAQEKARYEAKLKQLGVETTAQKKQAQKAKSKKSKTGYMLFCDANRETVAAKLKMSMGADFKYTQVMVALGHAWKNTPETEKVRYNEQAKKVRSDALLAEAAALRAEAAAVVGAAAAI